MALTLDQLKVLDAVRREGTFARAAARLGRVPSAVSYLIRGLEEATGVAIFDRSGHGAQWTPAGLRLLEEARAVLRSATRFEQLGRSLRDGWEATLSIVVDGGFDIAPVMRALKQFNTHDTPTRVRVHVEYQDGVTHRFERDGLDLMLMLAFEGTGTLQAEPLPPLEMVLVAAPDHPLAIGPTDQARLRQHVELVVRDSSPAFAETPREAWFGSEQVAWLPDFHSKSIAIRAGAGYGWLPEWLATDGLATGALVLVDFAEANRWTYHPHVVHRRDVPLGRASELFLACLRTQLGMNPQNC